jgi:hypothetical protein
MFVDEVILDLRPSDIAGLSCIQTIAVKNNIPVVVTCIVWNDREGLAGVRPSLTDVSRHSYLHGHDVVIGFTNYDQKRKQSLEELKESGGIIVESLIKTFDLSIEGCDPLPY